MLLTIFIIYAVIASICGHRLWLETRGMGYRESLTWVIFQVLGYLWLVYLLHTQYLKHKKAKLKNV